MEHGEQGRDEQCRMGLIPKGRRTKRYRLPQENVSCCQDNNFPSQVIDSSSPIHDSLSPLSSPPWFQGSPYEHTEEEQAVASYLILLSNSNDSPRRATPINEAPPVLFSEPKTKNNTSKWIGPDGQVYYRCTTCLRDFLSFQALGGHRASHKKPKLNQLKHEYNSRTSINEIKKAVEEEEGEDDMLKLSINSFSMAIAKTRSHQCTICNCKFPSGQALGGHMRRHRNPAAAPEPTIWSDEISPNMDDIKEDNEILKPNMDIKEDNEIVEENQSSPLALDLNLPAPMEEKRPTILSLSPEVNFHF